MSTGVIIVLARLLTPEDFGLVAVSTALVYFLTVIQDGGLPQALVQRETLRPEHVSTALTTNAALSVVLSALLFTGAPLISSLLGQPDASPIIRVLASNLLFGALSAVPAAMLVRRLEFRSLALRRVLAKVAGGGSALVVAFAGGGAWALVAQSVVQRTVGLAVLWWAVPDRPGFRFERRAFRELLAFGSFQLGNSVLQAVIERADNFAISRVLGSAPLGLYTIAYRVLDILQELFGKALNDVTMPVLSRRQTEPQVHRRATLDLVGLVFVVAAPAFVGWALVADPAIVVLFGDQWAGAVVTSQALAAVGLHRVLTGNLTVAINSTGRISVTFRLKMLVAAASLTVFVGFAGYGIETFAAAYAVAVWSTLPVYVFALRRTLGIGVAELWPRVWAPLVALGAMTAAVGGVRTSGILPDSRIVVLVASVALGGSVYVAAMAALDRALLERVVRRLRAGPRDGPISPT